MITAILITVLSACPFVRMELREDSEPDRKVDEQHQRDAERGCVKYYGTGACLTRFIKTADRSYQAVCRRAR